MSKTKPPKNALAPDMNFEEIAEKKALEKELKAKVLEAKKQERSTRREVTSLLDTIFYLLIFINAEKLVNSYKLMKALSSDAVDKDEYGTTVRQLVNGFVDN